MPDYHAVAQNLLQGSLAADFPKSVIAALARFVPVANDDLLRVSLKELAGAVKKNVPDDFMHRLHRVYNRRLAELSSLYPALHLFETSYRTFVAYTMSDIYGRDDWWRDFYDYAKSLDTTTRQPRPTSIGAKSISTNVGEAIFDFANAIKPDTEGSKLANTAPTLQLMQYCNLRHLEQLILNDWQTFKAAFTSDEVITSTNFGEMFSIVRTARNAVFHHRHVGRHPKLNSHLVELLDVIGVHLPSAYEDVLFQTGPVHAFRLAKKEYHHGLEPNRSPFGLTYRIGEGPQGTVGMSAVCESEAMMGFVRSQKASSISQLNLLQVTRSVPAEPTTASD